MRILMMLVLMTVSLLSAADDFRYKGSGRIDAIDFNAMVITITNKQYPIYPYSFKAQVNGHDLPLDLLKTGLMVKFYSGKDGSVGRVEVIGSEQLKRQLMNH